MPVINKCGGFVSTEPPQFYHLHLSPWFITCVFITCIYHLVYHLRLSPRIFDLSPGLSPGLSPAFITWFITFIYHLVYHLRLSPRLSKPVRRMHFVYTL
jgi:hypothetical protein